MAPTLRIEIFPADITASIQFYTQVLDFKLLRHEAKLTEVARPDGIHHTIDKGYAYLVSGFIYLGVDGSHPAGSLPARPEYRRPPSGVEVVVEVDDLAVVRERVQMVDWPIRPDEDVKMQPWGLRDFRIMDPDGYFLRITERSARANGTGC